MVNENQNTKKVGIFKANFVSFVSNYLVLLRLTIFQQNQTFLFYAGLKEIKVGQQQKY